MRFLNKIHFNGLYQSNFKHLCKENKRMGDRPAYNKCGHRNKIMLKYR